MARALRPALCALGWLAVVSSAAAGAGPPAVRASVPLPGGAAGLAAALGAPRPFDPATALLDAARLLHESAPGQSAAVDRRRRRFAAYAPPRPRGSAATNAARRPADTVPIPLAPEVWSAVVLGRPVPEVDLALAILADRRAALLYSGLFGLDDETLAYLSRDRRTLATLAAHHAAAFAAFGRSLRVRAGRVVTPGGDADRLLWEATVGAPVEPPGPFILALFGAAEGRLAYFYDTMAQLDEPRRRYALGADLPPERRLAAAQALARVFSTAHPGWAVGDRPFARPALDAALALRLLRVDPDGHLIGPVWPALLAHVFDNLPAVQPGTSGGTLLPADPGGAVGRVDPRERADAGWLLERVLSPLPQVGRARLDALLFGQRVFPDPDPADAAELLLAMRGRIVFPALAATLERLGVREPAVYATAVRRAASLMRIESRATHAAALAQFQGALGCLERFARHRILTLEATTLLLQQLVGSEVDPVMGYGGRLARWFEEAVGALGRVAGPQLTAAASAEDLIVRALAGALPSPRRADRIVEWDGERYRVDYGAPEWARLRAVRERQGGNDLDAVLAFASAAAELSSDRDGWGGRAEALNTLQTALGRLDPPVLASAHAGVSPASVAADARRALQALGASDGRGPAGPARTLVAYGDELLADVATALLYAPHLGGPDGPALAAGHVAVRHDFGLLGGRRTPWDPAPGWDFPTEDHGGGWHLQGALLGLDLALARLSLRYLSVDTMPEAPLVNANDWRTFAETAVLFDPHELRDADADALAEAIARGRRRLDALTAHPALLDELAAGAHLSGTRREVLRWQLAHDPGAASRSLSLAELLEMGGGRLPVAWGTSGRPASGCLCLEVPDPDAGVQYAGRPMTGLLAATVTDLTLRAMLELRVRELPAALVPAVLALATPDFLHAVRPVHADDREAFARAARELPADRFVEYLAALASGGPLVPTSNQDLAEVRRP